MSRVGHKLLTMPAGVTLTETDRVITVSGKKGKLNIALPEGINLKIEGTHALVTRADDSKVSKQNHGTTRAHLQNAINGVSKGYEKRLEIIGIGYKALMEGENLRLNIGYSHPVIITPKPGVKITCVDPTRLLIEGIDRQAVGETAANIRAVREPEPYQGKGIKYAGERIIRKEGKRAGKK